MRSRLLSQSLALAVLLLVAFLAGGCGESSQPPAAISMDQIPAELGKAFASAQGETKNLSGLAATAVQRKEFSNAVMALETLGQRPDLTKIQSRKVAGAFMTVNAALLEAEAKGDPQATETLKVRRMTK